MKKKNIIMIIICMLMLIIGIIIGLILNHEKIIGYGNWSEVFEVSNEINDNNTSELLKSSADFEKYVKNYSKSLYFDKYDYLLVSFKVDECSEKINGIRKIEVNDNIKIDIGYDNACGVCAPIYKYYIIPFEKNKINDNMKVEYNFILEKSSYCDQTVKKPMIYLYPTKKTNVKVKLGYPNRLTTTYPKYNNEWNVVADPQGNLFDIKTNRTYYGLYWEGINTNNKAIKEEGFIVEGVSSAKFLEEKLEVLGLNEREINEFIVYWLPKLESNKYNYIYFETISEIDNNMPLYIEPTPDTIIRVVMEYKGLDSKIDIKEQELNKVIRRGFTVVEWGGTEL